MSKLAIGASNQESLTNKLTLNQAETSTKPRNFFQKIQNHFTKTDGNYSNEAYQKSIDFIERRQQKKEAAREGDVNSLKDRAINSLVALTTGRLTVAGRRFTS